MLLCTLWCMYLFQLCFVFRICFFFFHKPRSGTAGSYVLDQYYFKEPPKCSPKWVSQYILLSTMQEGFLFSIPSPAFIIYRLFDVGNSDWYEMVSYYSLVCTSLIASNVEHLFVCLLVICMLLYLFCPFFICLLFWCWVAQPLCIISEITPIPVASVANIFYSIGYLFVF